LADQGVVHPDRVLTHGDDQRAFLSLSRSKPFKRLTYPGLNVSHIRDPY